MSYVFNPFTGTFDFDSGQKGAVGPAGPITYVNGKTPTGQTDPSVAGNSITLTKSDLSLGNVDNTSDAGKPVSTAQQTALDLKVDKVGGKGLTKNEFTDGYKNQLDGLGTASTRDSTDFDAAGAATSAIASHNTAAHADVVTAGSYTNSNITIDAKGRVTAAANGTGGSGAVSSVNAKTGTVVLSTADIADSTDKRYVTDTELTTLGNLTSGSTLNLVKSVSGGGAGLGNPGTDSNIVTEKAVRDAITSSTAGVSSVSGTAPIVSSGGATPAISISAATTSAAGSMSSADKTKLDAITGTNTGDQLTFKTITVSGQSDVVADTTTDTLTLVAGTNVTITTNAATDTITIASSGGSSGASLTQGTLAGRGAASGSGVYEGITLGTNLSMSGTTLNAAAGGGMTYPSAGVPVSTGSAWGTSLNITAISDSTSTTSSTTAASATAVKAAYDNGATQASSAITTHNADTTHSHLAAAEKTVATQAASSSVNGYMSTTYASKLDGIQASAAAVTSATPTPQAFGDAAVVGTGTTAARSDHKHAMMASPKDTTAITGILKGDGSVISPATAGTDYVAVSGALGTPSSGTLTNCTGYPNVVTQASNATAANQITKSGGADRSSVASGVTIDSNNAVAGAGTAINTQTASYTLVLGDAGKTIEMNVGSGNTLTIPANASVAFPVGTVINIVQVGAGQTTVAITSDTLVSSGSKFKLTGQYSGATLYKRASTTWVLIGDISA